MNFSGYWILPNVTNYNIPNIEVKLTLSQGEKITYLTSYSLHFSFNLNVVCYTPQEFGSNGGVMVNRIFNLITELY